MARKASAKSWVHVAAAEEAATTGNRMVTETVVESGTAAAHTVMRRQPVMCPRQADQAADSPPFEVTNVTSTEFQCRLTVFHIVFNAF